MDLNTITRAPTDDGHVAEYKAPANVNYSHRGERIAALLPSRIDAAVGEIRVDSPDIQPLIPDVAMQALHTFRRRACTRSIPYGKLTRIDASRLQVFQTTKENYLVHSDAGENLYSADETAIAVKQVVGDLSPFGISTYFDDTRRYVDALPRLHDED